MSDALVALDGEFSKLTSSVGRPSNAPEQLTRTSLLQAFNAMGSQRQLIGNSLSMLILNRVGRCLLPG